LISTFLETGATTDVKKPALSIFESNIPLFCYAESTNVLFFQSINQMVSVVSVTLPLPHGRSPLQRNTKQEYESHQRQKDKSGNAP
jgi:hypothetical protein